LENKSFDRELSYSDTVDKFLSSFPVTPESTKESKVRNYKLYSRGKGGILKTKLHLTTYLSNYI
jgi:hypothetical protein